MARIRISKFVIVESLESHEVKTGRLLAYQLDEYVAEYAPALKVQYEVCNSGIEFRTLVDSLVKEAVDGQEVPVLHLECHGSASDGIEFANGSSMAWDDLAGTLNVLNIATSFNLLIVLAACYGGHLMGEISAIRPAPCWGVVAPTNTVDPSDILRGFRTYYKTLLETGDAGYAAEQLSDIPISNGKWFAQPAQTWFEKMVFEFLETHCNKSAAKASARILVAKLRAEGFKTSCDAILENYRQINRTNLGGKYFDKFFSTNQIPEANERFSKTRDRIAIRIKEMRATGKYCI
jgi:hypothetical protein